MAEHDLTAVQDAPAQTGAFFVKPSHLFTPGKIGPLTLKNRVIMASMTTRTADEAGFVTDDSIAYYTARARGGVGLITVEMAAPERAGKHRHFELGICDDKFVPGLRKLADAIHEVGAKAGIQLGHGGGHTRVDICGETPIAPSAIPHVVQEGHTETIIPEQMSVERIAQTVRAFADAAVRAQRAGFDMVEIHAAHGYLISQFLTPLENQRTDQYGGSLENRSRFGLEILKEVKAAAPRLAVIFRLNGDDFFRDGLTFEEAKQVAVWAAEGGAHAIHMSGGHYRSQPSAAIMIPPMATPETPFLHYADEVRKAINVPVITVGRMGQPGQAIAAIENGHADFVALGRPLLADPEWVQKAENGEPVRLCLACNTCVDGMREGNPLHCLVNPVAGRERRFSGLTPELRDKHIAVLGAGPAGLTYAASVAAFNKVTVFEKSTAAGGAFRFAGLAPKFQNVEANARSLLGYIDSLVNECEEAGVTFKFSWNLRQHSSELTNFDHVVVATGAVYRAGMSTFISSLLRAGLLRAPLLQKFTEHPAIRKWFYEKARKPTSKSITRWLPKSIPATIIGDARVAGKSDAAVRDAVFTAFGLEAEPESDLRYETRSAV
ncbi:MAG: NADH oxidase [Betaproteobacteria bacterium]|nr:MAG: NADH oxidase [Betaproteobacteria bacterium]